jgi:hypothetical protein
LRDSITRMQERGWGRLPDGGRSVLVPSERLAETAGDARIRGTAGAVSIPLEGHDGPGARAGDQPPVSSDVAELPDCYNVPV